MCELNQDDVLYLANAHDSMVPKLKSIVLFFGRNNDEITEKLSPMTSELRETYQKCEMRIDVLAKLLFQKPWSNLTNLRMSGLNKESYKVVMNTLNAGMAPSLKELHILMWKYVKRHQLMSSSLMMDADGELLKDCVVEVVPPVNVGTLTDLTLQRLVSHMCQLYMVTKSSILTKLHKLDISHSSNIAGTLNILLCHSFPSLNSLILSDCELNSQDLCSLAQANIKGRLPELKHLDISENDGTIGHLQCLFTDSCTWPKLEKFNFQQSRELNQESYKLKPKDLPSLRELRLCVWRTTPLPISINQSWPHLHALTVATNEHNDFYKQLDSIADTVDKKLFPALRTVRILYFTYIISMRILAGARLRQKLRWAGVAIHYFYLNRILG